MHPRTSAHVSKVVVLTRTSFRGFGLPRRGFANFLPSRSQCHRCSLPGSGSLLHPSPQLPQRWGAREKRKRTREGPCSPTQERQSGETWCDSAGSRSPQDFPYASDWVPRNRRVYAEQHGHYGSNTQACRCYSCHPHDHEYDRIRERWCGITPINTSEHPRYNECAGSTERQEAEGPIQSPSSPSFGLASSRSRSRSDAVDWYCWPESPGVSDRGYVYFGSRQPGRCSCVDHQEDPRAGAGSERERIRRRTTSEFHRWRLALFELRLPGEHCYWKTKGTSWRQVSMWYLW